MLMSIKGLKSELSTNDKRYSDTQLKKNEPDFVNIHTLSQNLLYAHWASFTLKALLSACWRKK